MAQKKVATPAPTPARTPAADPTVEMRSKLFNRLAVAGGLVASLLAVLAFFDYLASPSDEPEAMVYTRPVPVAPKKEVSQPVTPATNLPEPPPPPASVEVAKTEQPPAPEVAAANPVVAENPSLPEVPRSSRLRPTASKAADSEAATANRPSSRVLPMRNYVSPSLPTVASSVPTPPSPSAAPRAKLPETPTDVTFPPSVPLAEQRLPSARVVQTQPATSAMPPVVQRLLSGFVLQAGVFTSQQRAEELHAKLTLSGVPSTLETRVQVGPFKTRQEAEAAQEKLRELGIGSVLVPPNKSGKH